MARSTVRTYKKNTLWPLFSKYIRLRDCIATTGKRDYGHCCSCGRRYAYEELQAGHFVPGRKNAYLFDEKGVHAQCNFCNQYLQGNWPGYKRFITEKYGADEVERQQLQYWEVRKFTLAELKILRKEIKAKYDELDNKRDI